ncbi:MAG: L,D-transpeptidase [Labilithrix sp.]|nr:L,D-transpeptidase [Labilithrix sp.]MCW5816828.1 L,D-transpeptidase [Labilithrix sp.]
MRSHLLFVSFSALIALGIAGCATEADDEDQGIEDELRAGSNSDKWVYNGPLPHLESPSIVMSRYTHTARVTGFLPAGYDASRLPFYAKDQARQVGGRTKIDVVYPVATGSSFNLPRGTYTTERIWARRTDSSAPWGGFPFISYVNPALSRSVGVAFHGPITSSDGEWELVRGPVSHGCNRMQGEHVVELAHLIGVDMTTKVYSGNTNAANIDIPVKVLVGESDVWEGQSVDVAYKAHSGVRRPTTNVKMFRTWRSQDFPSWVCRYTGSSASNIPKDYCAQQGHRNRFDGVAGPTQDAIDTPPPAGSCASASLGRTVEENTCVQRNRPGDVDDRKWFRCVDGEWEGPTTQPLSSCGTKFPAN